MLSSDLRSIYESYQSIYEEGDGISCEMIEEVVEELIEEYLEFGHNIDEAADVVEQAALQYLMELNPYAPAGSKDARAYQKSTTATKRGEARKTAVAAAKERVKSKVKGAVAAAGIAGSIAKDEARRAGRAAAHAVSSTVQKKKAEVKSGVKGLIGRGLRKAAGAVGKVAQKAAGAASRLGEEVIDEGMTMKDFKQQRSRQKQKEKRAAEKLSPTRRKGIHDPEHKPERDARRDAAMGETGHGGPLRAKKVRKAKALGELGEGVDTWDVVLEYLIANGHADTNSEALYIMSQLDEEMIQNIVETRMDPRGRPSSGPMNVYAKNKPNTDPKFQAALQAVRDADAKKTPEQRKAELDAYKARQANK